METEKFSQVVALWQKYNHEGLTPEAAKKAVTETLSLPWVQQMNVFADQFIALLELHTFNYLYISPSIEQITGYPHHDFTGAKFYATLIPPEELQLVLKINDLCVAKFAELKLQPDEMMKMRMSYNYFIKRKDGSKINMLQQYTNVVLSPQGLPLLQLVIVSDITAFNNKPEHFYKAVIVNEDGTERLLYSGKMENDEELISSREQEVLILVSRGQSSESIADKLSISVETVKAHRKNLLEKTKAKDTIDLVRYGYANGWL